MKIWLLKQRDAARDRIVRAIYGPVVDGFRFVERMDWRTVDEEIRLREKKHGFGFGAGQHRKLVGAEIQRIDRRVNQLGDEANRDSRAWAQIEPNRALLAKVEAVLFKRAEIFALTARREDLLHGRLRLGGPNTVKP